MNEYVDIEYLIRLVSEQEPERQDVVSALQNCKGGHWSENGYYSFVDSKNPNLPNSDWQHEECIVLEQLEKGDIVIDLLKNGRIGGIEFIDLIDK